MLEKIGSFGMIAFLLSFVLGVICLFYIVQILIKRKITIKVMAESMGESASDKSIIALVCVVLGVFSAGFFSVCLGIYFFTLGVS